MSELTDILKGLGDTIVSAVKDRVGNFLDENPEAEKFVKERAKRIIELGIELVQADDSHKPSIERSIKLAQQSIENELGGITLLIVSNETQNLFETVVKSVFGVVTDALPLLAKLKGL